jgi:hypothetical protein
MDIHCKKRVMLHCTHPLRQYFKLCRSFLSIKLTYCAHSSNSLLKTVGFKVNGVADGPNDCLYWVGILFFTNSESVADGPWGWIYSRHSICSKHCIVSHGSKPCCRGAQSLQFLHPVVAATDPEFAITPRCCRRTLSLPFLHPVVADGPRGGEKGGDSHPHKNGSGGPSEGHRQPRPVQGLHEPGKQFRDFMNQVNCSGTSWTR